MAARHSVRFTCLRTVCVVASVPLQLGTPPPTPPTHSRPLTSCRIWDAQTGKGIDTMQVRQVHARAVLGASTHSIDCVGCSCAAVSWTGASNAGLGQEAAETAHAQRIVIMHPASVSCGPPTHPLPALPHACCCLGPRPQGDTSIAKSVAWRPDGKALAYASFSGTIYVFDEASGDCLAKLKVWRRRYQS